MWFLMLWNLQAQNYNKYQPNKNKIRDHSSRFHLQTLEPQSFSLNKKVERDINEFHWNNTTSA